MARFRVSQAMVRDGVVEGVVNAIVGEPESGLTGVALRVVWTQERGVIEFRVSGTAGDVSWALNPQLATIAADAVVQFLADKTEKVGFEWSPPIEWGLRHIVGRDATVKPIPYATEEEAREAQSPAYDLYARIAPGPWGLIQEGEDR